MTPAAVLHRLRSAGVAVAREDGGLYLDGTESALTPDLLDLAREHRAGLLAFLSAPCPCGPCREPGALATKTCCWPRQRSSGLQALGGLDLAASRFGHGQDDGKRRAAIGLAVAGNVAAMTMDDRLANAQSQAGSAHARQARARGLGSVKALKNVPLLVGRDALPRIVHLDVDLARRLVDGHVDDDLSAGVRVFDGIIEQVH